MTSFSGLPIIWATCVTCSADGPGGCCAGGALAVGVGGGEATSIGDDGGVSGGGVVSIGESIDEVSIGDVVGESTSG